MRYKELFEFKQLYDLRHEPTEMTWNNKIPEYISPQDGFYFLYHKGELVISSTDNENYSAKVLGSKPPTHLWNNFSGLVNLKAKEITISKENYGDGMAMRQRDVYDIKEAQKAFKELSNFGVTEDFKLKGLPPEFPKKVHEFMMLSDKTDAVAKQQQTVLYHGTSMKRWKIIEKQGLRPGNTPDEYTDLIKNYSENNVYLAYTAKGAEFYGKRQANKDRDTEYVILKVIVPDMAKIIPDDRFASYAVTNNKKFEPQQYTAGRRSGEVAYRGIILPKYIELLTTKKYTGSHAQFVKNDRVSHYRASKNWNGTVTKVYGSNTENPYIDVQLDNGDFLEKQRGEFWRNV